MKNDKFSTVIRGKPIITPGDTYEYHPHFMYHADTGRGKLFFRGARTCKVIREEEDYVMILDADGQLIKALAIQLLQTKHTNDKRVA